MPAKKTSSGKQTGKQAARKKAGAKKAPAQKAASRKAPAKIVKKAAKGAAKNAKKTAKNAKKTAKGVAKKIPPEKITTKESPSTKSSKKRATGLKLISWNVNGIRAALGKGFADFVAAESPDILCLQEVKAQADQVELNFPGYEIHWNSAEKKGYSGTLVMSRPGILDVRRGLSAADPEGRALTCEYDDFFLVNVYTPNAAEQLKRLDFRMAWDRDFLAYIKQLEKRKPVIFCGDTNVAHKEIDLKNPKSNRKNPGFTDEERAGFSAYIDAGFIDTFREFNQEPDQYTWWSYRFNSRAKNVGWRLDYFVISAGLRPRLKDAFILADVHGSDHCPVGMILE